MDFPGSIGRTVADSQPWWPGEPQRDRFGPNIITIVLDDTGWSDFGCFGSEVHTPSIDALASNGLRYTNFHVTPLCTPTRACLMTGRNHHNVGVRCLADSDTGFPNSRGAIHADVAKLPQLLGQAGYGNYMVGKWHLCPAHEMTPAGPYHNWPIQSGFDRYYGFLSGATDHYRPEVVEDNSIQAKHFANDYHLSEDLLDRAVSYLRDHVAFRAQTPFYLNVSFGATHAPIQVARNYIDDYVAVFEKGWDQTRLDRLARQKALGLVPQDTELAERNPDVEAWDSLPAEHKRLFMRMQAAYAGFLEHTDAQIGRLVAVLKRLGLFDNTLILVFSDNGASREGGANGAVDINSNYSGHPQTLESMLPRIDDIGLRQGPAHYPQGWAMAGNTPFRRYKQWVELGGTRSALIASWPLGITEHGGVRDQFVHVIDIAPTIMDLAGATHSAAFDGASFSPTLIDASATTTRRVQYWESLGRRAIYSDGWKAVTEHEKGDDYASDRWKLYHSQLDVAETTDLARKHPEKLTALKDLWWREAEANDVLPLDDRTLVDIINFRQPNGLMAKDKLTLYPGQGHIPSPTMVSESLGGYVLYIKNKQLCFEHIRMGDRQVLNADMPRDCLTCGLMLIVNAERTATASLFADSQTLAQLDVPEVANHLSFWGLDVGQDRGCAVSDQYELPFAMDPAVLDRVEYHFLSEHDAVELAQAIEGSQ